MVETARRREIQEVLNKHAPELACRENSDENDVADYLVQLLDESESCPDMEVLLWTLAPYFGGDKDVASKIIHELIKFKGGNLMDEPAPKPQKKPENETDGKTKTRRKPRQKHQNKDPQKNKTKQAQEETAVEDDSSEWKLCVEQGLAWGGRGRGGRGEYSGAVNHVKSNIHLANVTVSLPNGADLLTNSVMDIQRGHRYGLIGRNGVGKSTLLKRLAQKAIPGIPHDMRILLVQQQVDDTDKLPVDVLLETDKERLSLLEEQERLEKLLENAGEMADGELVETAERLGQIASELDAIDAEKAEVKAIEILKGLQFTSQMLQGPTSNLSGGWRMRLALARALFVESHLLLLDEATNHIDLNGLDWLIGYLTRNDDQTMILVSHDRFFLDSVCTDIMHLSHQKLTYHPGNFSEFERQQNEKSAREARILDDAERRRIKAEAFVQKQQASANKKSADPNKQRQAKMLREKKLDRIGNYREDGKRYKLNSLTKLDEKYLRLPQKLSIEVDDPAIKMHFPDPDWTGIAQKDPIIRLESFSFGYSNSETETLKTITVNIERCSKVALVGKNGSGKTTLMRLLAREIDPNDHSSSGDLWHHPNIRIGHVTQYSVEELDQCANQTVVDYAEERFRNAKASSAIVSNASGNVRQYLGAFGLGGKHALQLIGKLSGGERMRLCFATILAEEPHLLLLDESTNHCDYEMLDSMSKALNIYQGAVLMVSHNQGFLSGFCKELWVLENGRITVNHCGTESFEDLFTHYRSAATRTGENQLSERRREQTTLAKRATKQRTGTSQNTALL